MKFKLDRRVAGGKYVYVVQTRVFFGLFWTDAIGYSGLADGPTEFKSVEAAKQRTAEIFGTNDGSKPYREDMTIEWVT